MFCPNKTDRPYPCPIGTYNNAKGAYEEAQCLDCPVGSFCYEEGVDDYEDYLCPIGQYCDEEKMEKPKLCPDGTFRNTTGASNKTDDCWICPEGFYCPAGTAYPLPCEAGNKCPGEGSIQYECPEGYFCEAMS